MMKQELLASEATRREKIYFDPRTKILLLITISVFVLGGSGGANMLYFAPVLSFIPLILLMVEMKYKMAGIYVFLYGGSFLLEIFALPYLRGVPNFIAVAVCGLFLRFVPGIMMGYYTVTTMTISEFIASMEKMHMPKQIVIPMSTMFRFFPTVMEEFSAVNDAMKMRGIGLGGTKINAMIEYRLVPMLMCSVKIGEELSIAALTRGLGGPVKRTNICKIGFHIQDVILILICVIAFIIPFATI